MVFEVLPPIHSDSTDPAEHPDYYSVPEEEPGEFIELRCKINGKTQTIILNDILSVYENWISHSNLTRIEAFLRLDGDDHYCVANIHTGPYEKLLSDITVYRKEK